MKNRDLWYLICAAISISVLAKFLELYRNVLLITVGVLVILAILALFAKFVGPSLPEYLGGDPKPQLVVRPEKELELYQAMVFNDLEKAKACLVRGADPFKKFTSHFRPPSTDSNSCYEHAKLHAELIRFRELFGGIKVGT